MKQTKTHCRIISIILVLSLVAVFVLTTRAEAPPNSLSIQCDDGAYNLDAIKNGSKWYAEISSLSDIGKCEYSINSEKQIATLYKTEPLVILYSIDLDSCYIRSGSYFVPLEEAALSAGIRFYGDNLISAAVYRTPKQMLAEFDEVFYDQRYQITQLLLTDGYAVAETAARIYAILPFVGSGSLAGAISGADEKERYATAFASILTNDGSTTDLMSSMADISGDVHKNAKTLKAVKNLTAKNGKLYDFLLSKGISPDFLNSLAYERDPYDPLDGLFEDGSAVLSAINFEHFLDLCAFYAVSVDAEESVLVAMKRVFENSSNEESRHAVEKLMDTHYGKGNIAIADIYGGMIWDISTEYINGKAEELFYGGYAAGAALAARGIDTVFQASDKSEAYIFFPIYASIQQDLYDYYLTHRHDTQEHTMYDLRAVTIMYLKAAIAAYEYAEFDDSLADVCETAILTLNDELANVMSYSETEYAPQYDCEELVVQLDKAYSGTIDEDTGSETLTQQTDTSYIGTWLFDYWLPVGEGEIVISEDSISVFTPSGECGGPYSYEVSNDGIYTRLNFIPESGEHGVIVYINPDMIGMYIEDPLDSGSASQVSFGASGDGEILYRQGAGRTDLPLPKGYYDMFSGGEVYEHLYFSAARVLYVWNPGMGYFPMYVYDDGSLEYMESISLVNNENLPDTAIATNSNFVIVDNK